MVPPFSPLGLLAVPPVLDPSLDPSLDPPPRPPPVGAPIPETALSATAKARRRELDLKAQLKDRDPKELRWNQVMRRVFAYLLRHPFLVAASLLITFVLAGVEILALSLFFPFLDALTGGGGGASLAEETPLGFMVPYFQGMSAVEKVRAVAIGLIVIEIAKSCLLYLLARVSQYLNILVGRDIRMQVFDTMMSVDLAFLNKQKTSNLFTILHSFPSAATAIVSQVMMALQNSTSFVVLVVSLLLIDWKLTLLAAVLALIVNVVVIQLSRIVRRRAKALTKSRLELHKTTLESLQSMKLIHLYARLGHTRRRFLSTLTKHQDNQYAKARITSFISPFHSFLNTAFMAAVLIGATFIMAGRGVNWVALLAAFMVVVSRFMGRSGKYAKRRTKIAEEIPAMEAVIDFLERDDKTYLKDGRQRFDRLRQGVQVQNLTFRYDADGQDVLHDVSFDVPRGSMIALVGGSGAGKSTLVDLVARLYDPNEGRVLVDGRDVRELQIKDWRRRIAVVSQQTTLLNQSIRDNIRFGRLDATDAEIEEAARQANAHDFIASFDHGYDTPVGDRGARLSGGQAQRIAIARAILADPDILILDEATSALDTKTEHLVQEAIERLGQGRTVIAVAHRLSTIRRADQIIVLEHGRIVERGRHEELVERRGAYWQYVRLQDLGEGGGDLEDGVEAEVTDLLDLGIQNLQTVLEAEDIVVARRRPGGGVPSASASERAIGVPVLIRLAGPAVAYEALVRDQPGVEAVWADGRALRLFWNARRSELPRLLRTLMDAGAVPVAFGRPPHGHEAWDHVRIEEDDPGGIADGPHDAQQRQARVEVSVPERR